MHSITLNQNWKKVRVTLDPPQKGPSRKGNEPTSTTKFVDILGVSLYIPFSTSLKQSYIKAISHFYTLVNALLLYYIRGCSRLMRQLDTDWDGEALVAVHRPKDRKN
jgi:hypothetical protein